MTRIHPRSFMPALRAPHRGSATKSRAQSWRGMEQLESRLLLSVSLDAGGWTVVEASQDTRIIYVSSSQGSDANDGLSADSAVKTLEKAKSLVRDGMPDWILLRRGDVWFESLGKWEKSGRSADEPLLISTYGESTQRAVLMTGSESAISTSTRDTVSHVMIKGLHFYAHTRDPDGGYYKSTSGSNGITWRASGENFHLEDVKVESYTFNIVIEASGGFNNFTLRRSQIIDSYSATGHAQGLYATKVHGLVLEENLFDHNGWNSSIDEAHATIFNHGAYIQVDCTGLVARGNTFSRSSSHGLQARPGGIVENNLFIDNPIGLSFGLVYGGAVNKGLVPEEGVGGHVIGNVFLDGGDIGPGLPRGGGLELGNLNGAVISHNLIANDGSDKAYGSAIKIDPTVGGGMRNVVISDNIIDNWRGNIRVEEGGHLHNVVFRDNKIHDPNGQTHLLRNRGKHSNELKFQNNLYDTTRSSSKWMDIDNDNYSLDQFKALTGSTDREVELTFPDADRTIASYSTSIGGAASMDAYLHTTSQMSAGNWNANHVASHVVKYFQAGYGFDVDYTPPAPPPPPTGDQPSEPNIPEPAPIGADLDVSDSSGDPTNLRIGLSNTDVGQTSYRGSFTLRNAGDQTLSITNLVLGGEHADDFIYDVIDANGNTISGSSFDIAAGEDATIQVWFKPTDVGGRHATLTFNTNSIEAGEQALTLNMSALGTGEATVPDVDPTPEPDPEPVYTGPSLVVADSSGNPHNLQLGLSSTYVGEESYKGTYTLHNTGDQPLTISNFKLGGEHGGDFIYEVRNADGDVVTGDTFTIEAGEEYAIVVRFVPTATGGRLGELTFNTNSVEAGQEQLTLRLAARGLGETPAPTPEPEPEPEPEPIYNGPSLVVADSSGDPTNHQLGLSTTTVGERSYRGTFTLHNDGDQPLTVSNLTLAGAHPSDFIYEVRDASGNVVTGDSFTIAAGDAYTVEARFVPTEAGARLAQLTFDTNSSVDGQQSMALNLAALGVAAEPQFVGPSIEVTDSSNDPHNHQLGLSTTVVGETSYRGTFTLQNNGDQPLAVSNLTLAGMHPSDFTYSVFDGSGRTISGSDFAIEAGASFTIRVYFRPTDSGGRNATLTFDTNSVQAGQQKLSLNMAGLGLGSVVVPIADPEPDSGAQQPPDTQEPADPTPIEPNPNNGEGSLPTAPRDYDALASVRIRDNRRGAPNRSQPQSIANRVLRDNDDRGVTRKLGEALDVSIV